MESSPRLAAPFVILPALALALGLVACDRGTPPPSRSAAAPVATPLAIPPVAVASRDGGGDASAHSSAPSSAPPKFGTLTRPAGECLEDVSCSAAEAERRFIAADDGRDPDVVCFRFLDGTAVARDVARARACLERTTGTEHCDGSSLDLGTAELALMRIDGIAGAVDMAGARALIDPCFDDVARQGLIDHADAKARDPKTRPVDFCKEIGGTTMTAGECSSRGRDRAAAKEQLLAKVAAAPLDPAGKALFTAVEKAFAAYTSAMSSLVATTYAGGTMRGIAGLSAEIALRLKRVASLSASGSGGFAGFTAANPSKAEVDKAVRDEAAAVAKAGAQLTPEAKLSQRQAEDAWKAYRDAELALYAHVYGTTPDAAAKVRATMTIRLANQRAKDALQPEP